MCMGSLRFNQNLLIVLWISASAACTSSYQLAALKCDSLSSQNERSYCKHLKQTSKTEKRFSLNANLSNTERSEIKMHFNTAQVHFDNDETYSGIEELDKIIDSHPKLAEAHFSKGMALLSMDKMTRPSQPLRKP